MNSDINSNHSNNFDDTFNHLNTHGEAHMVDVGDKAVTKRIAIATGKVQMQPATLNNILHEQNKKGSVLGVARIAGIMGCKNTANMIPLCHPLPLNHINIDLQPHFADANNDDFCGIFITVTCHTEGKTGVEMEALTGASICALTIYDMCKGQDRYMVISDIQVTHKSGGKTNIG